ncbi:3-methyl-2-oxobutanoate hydroxymethyltransferase, partial [Escherichia coli]|nr:3-methyl-2-oxobutanoate hydroxymethyltransferase [Escherichia coli]
PALASYVKEVKAETFPEVKHSFTMAEEDLKGLYGRE